MWKIHGGDLDGVKESGLVDQGNGCYLDGTFYFRPEPEDDIYDLGGFKSRY
jgi:hypothetical protein